MNGLDATTRLFEVKNPKEDQTRNRSPASIEHVPPVDYLAMDLQDTPRQDIHSVPQPYIPQDPYFRNLMDPSYLQALKGHESEPSSPSAYAFPSYFPYIDDVPPAHDFFGHPWTHHKLYTDHEHTISSASYPSLVSYQRLGTDASFRAAVPGFADSTHGGIAPPQPRGGSTATTTSRPRTIQACEKCRARKAKVSSRSPI